MTTSVSGMTGPERVERAKQVQAARRPAISDVFSGHFLSHQWTEECHQVSIPIEVLVGRESMNVAHWLRRHPSSQVVTRDRAGAYSYAVRNPLK